MNYFKNIFVSKLGFYLRWNYFNVSKNEYKNIWRCNVHKWNNHIKSLKLINKSISEFAGAMFSLLPKPLFRDLYEKLHQAIGKLDWQVDICLSVLLKSAPFCYSQIWRKFLQTNFAFRGEGIAFSEKTLQVISEMFLIMIITEYVSTSRLVTGGFFNWASPDFVGWLVTDF